MSISVSHALLELESVQNGTYCCKSIMVKIFFHQMRADVFWYVMHPRGETRLLCLVDTSPSQWMQRADIFKIKCPVLDWQPVELYFIWVEWQERPCYSFCTSFVCATFSLMWGCTKMASFYDGIWKSHWYVWWTRIASTYLLSLGIKCGVQGVLKLGYQKTSPKW